MPRNLLIYNSCRSGFSSTMAIQSLCLLCLAFMLFLLLFGVGASNKHSFDSIYQFGDSISDTGNFIIENPTSATASLPYGETFFHRPTGRNSDGLLMIDFLAKAYRIPLLNPYLERNADFKHGVNFAVAGSTALSTSVLELKNITVLNTNSSLSVQLKWFRTHLKSICSSKPDCKNVLRKALFMLGPTGGNDYLYALTSGKSFPDLYKLVPDVIHAIKHAVKEVIDHGAAHVVVPGYFRKGCLSFYLVAFATNDTSMYDDFKCIKAVNEFNEYHNLKLQDAIKELQHQYPGVFISYGDIDSAFTWVIQNADSLGFEIDGMLKACCGAGNNAYNFNFTSYCGTPGVPACADPLKRVNWDGFHVTQQTPGNMGAHTQHQSHLTPCICFFNLQVTGRLKLFEMAFQRLCILCLPLILLLHPFVTSSNSFDSIYQFGDSISDTGNFIRENPTSFIGSLPYGETFFHRPTGRSSDGLLMVDFIAKAYHLPFLKPYLEKEADFSHGVNFAVAGSTALSTSVLELKNITVLYTNSSLSVQIKWFKTHLKSICSSKADCKHVLRKALFLVGPTGGNDYLDALTSGKSIPDLYKLVPDVIHATKHAVRVSTSVKVIDQGAVHVVVPDYARMGCLSYFLVAFASNDSSMYDEFKCIKAVNEVNEYHNLMLQEAIKELQRQYPSVSITYGDTYSAFTWVIRNAESLGFEKDGMLKACCGAGNNAYNFNVSSFCGSPGVPACAEPLKRVNWDGSHVTQQVYRHLATWLLTHNIRAI
ncbi:LOW QUALITY PROTEIN: hypothetical protein V2J09_019396 [Rumex salicifolius]